MEDYDIEFVKLDENDCDIFDLMNMFLKGFSNNKDKKCCESKCEKKKSDDDYNECILFWKNDNMNILNKAINEIKKNKNIEFNKLLPIYNDNKDVNDTSYSGAIGYFMRVHKCDVDKYNLFVKDYGKPGIYYVDSKIWFNNADENSKKDWMKEYCKLMDVAKLMLFEKGHRTEFEILRYIENARKLNFIKDKEFVSTISRMNDILKKAEC